MRRHHWRWIKICRTLMLRCVVIAVLLGCGGPSRWFHTNDLEQLTAGMNEEAVIQIAGKPDHRYDFAPGKFVLYYRNAGAGSGGPDDPDRYTPVSFEEYRLLALGQDLRKAWQLQEAENRSETSAPDSTGKNNVAWNQRSKSRAGNILARERQEKIDVLERVVRPIPAAAVELNLQLYQDLLALDPGNSRYRKKVSYYDWRRREAEKLWPADSLNEKETDAVNAETRGFRGNNHLQMAVHIMNRAALYLWIKNTGDREIKIVPEHFYLLDRGNRAVMCSPGKDLITTISPGETVHGRFYYQSGAELGKLVCIHPSAGEIRFSFPQ